MPYREIDRSSNDLSIYLLIIHIYPSVCLSNSVNTDSDYLQITTKASDIRIGHRFPSRTI